MPQYKLPDELMFLQNSKAQQRTTQESMKGKICVITGATSGVGLEATKKLAAAGAHIVMVCRNFKKAEIVRSQIKETSPVPIEIIVANFSELAEVRRAAELILKSYPHIDVLINSAGLHSTKRTYTKEGFETVFCVNHLSTFLLTSLLLERMKQSSPSRIIQVNSEGHRFNGFDMKDLNWKKRFYTGLRSYGASKTAQLLTTWEFADQLKGSGVTINAMHPGDVRTNIGSNNGPLYRWFLHNIIWHSLKDPKIAGEALYFLAAAPELAQESGRFFHLTIDEKPAKHAMNRAASKEIFEISKKLTGLI